MIFDQKYLDYQRIAISQAQYALESSEDVPVGAALIDDKGQVLSAYHNEVYKRCDPTAHAEILCIREACAMKRSVRLDSCSLFVTLEPCVMCARAIAAAHLEAVFFSCSDNKYGGLLYDRYPNTNYRPKIFPYVLEKEAQQILREFFAKHRISAKIEQIEY